MKRAVGKFFAVLIWVVMHLAVWAEVAAAQICKPFPGDGTRVFDVVRHDQVLGQVRYDFSRDTESLFVRVDSTYAIGPVNAPFYRFEHHSEEVWQGGRMRALVSDTEENGQRWRLRMGWDGKQLEGTSNGMAIAVSGLAVPTSLWHRDTPKSEALVSVIDGSVRPIQVYELGEMSLEVNGAVKKARGFILVGGFERKVWYDEECQLVRASLIGQDGQELSFELRPILVP